MKRTNKKYARALRKVEMLKEFYRHLTTFIIINTGLILWWSNLFGAGKTDFTRPGIYVVFFFWGIGMFWHGMFVLYELKLKKFGKQWEEQKIADILEKEKNRFEEYKKGN